MTDQNTVFERIFQLTTQLKGAPLKEFERQAIRDEFEKAQGTPLEQAKQAITKVLHAEPNYIDEKSELLEDVNQMVEDIRNMTESGGKTPS